MLTRRLLNSGRRNGTIIVRRQGVRTKCKRIKMPGDGACLFSTLSFLMFQTVSMAGFVRSLIVAHVTQYWARLRTSSFNQHLGAYTSARQYKKDMSNPRTYGSSCELIAAGEVFNFQFQLYTINDGQHIGDFGSPVRGVRRMCFVGSFDDGHFDALIPLDEYDPSIHNIDKSCIGSPKKDKPRVGKGKRRKCSKTEKNTEIKVDDANETKTESKKIQETIKNDDISPEDTNRNRFPRNCCHIL